MSFLYLLSPFTNKLLILGAGLYIWCGVVKMHCHGTTIELYDSLGEMPG